MKDIGTFKHGEEGTHYVCQEVLRLKGGKATCCGCGGHKCKKPNPMKRIKKECKHKWEDTVQESMKKCRCGKIQCRCKFCSPKPTKIKKININKEQVKVILDSGELDDTEYGSLLVFERLADKIDELVDEINKLKLSH